MAASLTQRGYQPVLATNELGLGEAECRRVKAVEVGSSGDRRQGRNRQRRVVPEAGYASEVDRHQYAGQILDHRVCLPCCDRLRLDASVEALERLGQFGRI